MKSKDQKKKRKNEIFHLAAQLLLLILLIIVIHALKNYIYNQFLVSDETDLKIVDENQNNYAFLFHHLIVLQKEILDIKSQINQLKKIDIPNQILKELEKYSSDEIGIYDYAAEYNGGRIIDILDTLPFKSQDSWQIFDSFPLEIRSAATPKDILKTSRLPGDCFAFHGNCGRIQIKLRRPITITHVSLEHIRIGDFLDSAPNHFSILGFNGTWVVLGDFIYDLSGHIVQTFATIPMDKMFDFIELRINDNYGNLEFTCVYRLRVHSLSLNFNDSK